MAKPSLHWADWLLIAILMLLSIVIGLIQGRTSNKGMTKLDYFFGSNKMRIVPVAFSITASFLSAILIVGVPAETYIYGIAHILWAFSFTIANFISAFTIVPVLYPLQMTSAYEYLELRFQNRAVRVLAACLAALCMVMISGVVAYAPATALAAVSPVPSWASVIVIVAVATIYSSLGGIRAVIWTDVLQVIIMLAGILAILIKGFITQGASEIFEINKEGGRLEFKRFFDFDPRRRTTFWSICFGSVVASTCYTGYNQAFFQRFKSVPTMRRAQGTLLVSAIGFPLLIILSAINGFVMYSHFSAAGCDPFAAGYIKNPNQFITYYVLSNFQFLYGFLGLLLAALFSACMSTLSSNINSTTAVIWEDMLQFSLGSKLSQSRINILLKAIGFVLGAVIIAIGVVADRFGGSLIQVVIVMISAINSPLLGLYYLGTLYPWMNAAGALAGTVCGFVINAWIAIGSLVSPPDKSQQLPYGGVDNCPLSNSTFTGSVSANYSLFQTTQPLTSLQTTATSTPIHGLDNLYHISHYYIGLVGMIVQCIVANIVCFVVGYTDPHSVDPKYLLVSLKRCCFSKPKQPKDKMEMENGIYNAALQDD